MNLTPFVVEIPGGPGRPAFISTTATGCKATPRTFTLTWGVSSNATRYELKQRNDTDSTESSIPATGTSITLTRSSAPYDIIVYNYQVRGCNAANVCSAWNAGNPPSDYAYVCIGTPLSPNAPLVSTVRYLHTDALGSPVAETNETGSVVKRTRYEAYGAPTDGIYADGPGYTGHVTDEATRLTYMQQRYYDPMAARFLSLDPVTTDASTGVGFNRYGYANNNPYRFVDPDGRQSFPFGITPGQAEYARAADAARANYGKALAPVAEAISFALPKAAFVEGGASVDVGAAAPSVSATGSVGVHMPFAEGSPNNFYASGGVMAAGPNSSASLPAATEGTLQFAAGASVSPGLSFGITNAPTVSTFSGQTSSVRVDTPAVTIQGSLSSGGIWSLSVGTPAAGISAAKQEVNTIPLTEKMQ